jgi:predicted transcriptional regulator
MEELFLQKKPKEILFYLKSENSANISEIAAKTNSTYAHSFNLIRELEDLGIVITKKKGRSKVVTLTEKGRDLAALLEEFVTMLRSGKTTPQRMRRRGADKKASISASDKLARYYEKLKKISEKVKSDDISSQKSKIKRVVGRYRQIIKKMRPRDEKGRQLRKAALMEIESILKNLS